MLSILSVQSIKVTYSDHSQSCLWEGKWRHRIRGTICEKAGYLFEWIIIYCVCIEVHECRYIMIGNSMTMALNYCNSNT